MPPDQRASNGQDGKNQAHHAREEPRRPSKNVTRVNFASHMRLILNPSGAVRVLTTPSRPPVFGSRSTRLRPVGVRSSGNFILTSTGSPGVMPTTAASALHPFLLDSLGVSR